MNARASSRHFRRVERLRRETTARKGWLLLWGLLALFLIVCLVFAIQ